MIQIELRPRRFTNAIDLTIEPVKGVTTQTDIGFTTPDGENIKRSEDVITLDYEEVEWLKQGLQLERKHHSFLN